MPAGTHVLLGTYHAGRCEKLWGLSSTGFPAVQFMPERWEEENLAKHGRTTKDAMHFGFGHGPRVCIGKHFSEAEAFVCLTLFLRRFEFTPVTQELVAKSGVSTSPGDSVNLRLSLRFY
ncbi:MAG: cytochrome P450 [Isosphaeraceae bacterium]